MRGVRRSGRWSSSQQIELIFDGEMTSGRAELNVELPFSRSGMRRAQNSRASPVAGWGARLPAVAFVGPKPHYLG